MRNKRKKKKYYCVFVLKEQGTFTKLKKKKFKPTGNSVRYKRMTFLIDTSFATYSVGLKQFFYVDFKKGQMTLKDEKSIKERILSIKEFKKKLEKAKDAEDNEEYTELLKLDEIDIDPEIADLLISRKIIGQITGNLSDTALKMSIITLIIGGIIGACIGYIIAGI